jgi:amino acid transporter
MKETEKGEVYMEKQEKKLGLGALILMIFTSVYGFNNIPRSFYLMGYAAIPWFILAGITFFVPYAFMVAEYGSAFKNETGGIYSWMEKSVGPKYAFVATFMWYTSYVLWMVNICSGIWVPVSNALFGKDTSATWKLFGMNWLSGPRLLGILGIIFMIFITAVASKGLNNIQKVTNVGGIAVIVINIVVLVGGFFMIIANHGHFAQPFEGMHSLGTSLNAAYAGNPIMILSFIVYALFAYGGLEAVGGLVDKTENPKKTFPKGVMIAAVVVVVGYSVLILLVGSFTNYKEVMGTSGVHLGNVSYVIMGNFGKMFGETIGVSASTAAAMGHNFARIYGLIMLLSLLGAFFTLSYSPLKQIIDGTPAELWPGKMGVTRDYDGMPVNAMKIQCIVVCIMIFGVSFGGNAMAKFFVILTDMVNVGMTVPYIFIAAAFPAFKKLQNLDRPFVMYKSHGSTMFFAFLVSAMLIFANVFAIIQPAIEGDFMTTVWTFAGPLIFSAAALLMYGRYEKKVKNHQIPAKDNSDNAA